MDSRKFSDPRLCKLKKNNTVTVTKPKLISNPYFVQCSSNCGEGTQRRQVKCFDRKYRLASEETCDPLLRPANIRQCSNYLCTPAKRPKPKMSTQWRTGSWGEVIIMI